LVPAREAELTPQVREHWARVSRVPSAKRSSLVRLAEHPVAARMLRNGSDADSHRRPARSFLLRLFEDAEFVAIIDDVEPSSREGNIDGFSAHADIVRPGDALVPGEEGVGGAAFTYMPGRLFGRVHWRGQVFVIWPLDDGFHIVFET